MTFVSPNQFQLSGHGLSLEYTTTGIDGQPHFSYHDHSFTKSFSGNEISTEDTALGSLVSVRLMLTIDAGSTTFTLLIPRINLNPGETVHVRTEGILTIHRLSIVQSLNHGQRDHYTVKALRGTAQNVVF